MEEFVAVMDELTREQRAERAKRRSTTVARWKKGVAQVGGPQLAYNHQHINRPCLPKLASQGNACAPPVL